MELRKNMCYLLCFLFIYLFIYLFICLFNNILTFPDLQRLICVS